MLLDNRDEIQETIKAWREKFTLAKATRLLVHQLFGDKGLIIIDPDSPTKPSISPFSTFIFTSFAA